MALIRAVKRNSGSGMWGYIEWSDEDPNNTIHMVGSQEFAEEQDCIDYSKGFAPESYEWVEPKELKQKRLLKEMDTLSDRLSKVKDELIESGYNFEIEAFGRGFYETDINKIIDKQNPEEFARMFYNEPERQFDWNGYMAMLEYEKICRAKYDRPHPLPSLPPRQPHRMIDFAHKYHTSIEAMKLHERQVESDLRQYAVQIVVNYQFNKEESRIEIYEERNAKLIKIHQVKRKGGPIREKHDFNQELLRVFTEFPNNTIITDPRSKDWRINNCLNPNHVKWNRKF